MCQIAIHSLFLSHHPADICSSIITVHIKSPILCTRLDKIGVMKGAFAWIFVAFVAFSTSSAVRRPIGSISSRDARFEAELIEAPLAERFDKAALHYFEKRKGGGGSGGGGGRSGGSSGSGSGSGTGSGSGSSSGSGSGSGRAGGSSSGGGGRTGNAG